MSSTESSSALTLNQLLELADKYLPGDHVIRDYGWDFENSKLQAPEFLEPIPEFVCRDIQTNFEPGARDLVQVSDLVARLNQTTETLSKFQRDLQGHLHWMLLRDFWRWFKESKRTTYTPGLLKAWIEVHSLDLVREVEQHLLALASTETPLKELVLQQPVMVGPDIIAEMENVLAKHLTVVLQEPVVATVIPTT